LSTKWFALTRDDREALLASVDWRNELIHEYETHASNEIFYAALKPIPRGLSPLRGRRLSGHRALAARWSARWRLSEAKNDLDRDRR